MRPTVPDRLEKGRVMAGPLATPRGVWWGMFVVPCPTGAVLRVMVAPSGADAVAECCGWEHVSVSLADRCPTWDEMAWVKDLCWGPEECVVQFHPPRAEYVNHHPFCLHLWRPAAAELPRPPAHLVGPARREVAHA